MAYSPLKVRCSTRSMNLAILPSLMIFSSLDVAGAVGLGHAEKRLVEAAAVNQVIPSFKG